MTGIFCGKLFRCPVREATEARNDRRYPHKYGVVCSIHRQAAQQHDRVAKHAPAISLEVHTVKLRLTQANEKRVASGLRGTACSKKLVPKIKDPSGGTTGRVKPYGRLGWMGARAEYSYGEEITAPTHYWSPKGWRTFKTAGDFFNPKGSRFSAAGYLLSGGSVAVAGVRFFRRHGRDRRIERPRARQFLRFRSIFARLHRSRGRLIGGRRHGVASESWSRPVPQRRRRPLPRRTDHHDPVNRGRARSASEPRATPVVSQRSENVGGNATAPRLPG